MAAVRSVQTGLDYIAAVTDQQFSALSGRVSGLEAGFANLDFRIDELDKDYRRGVAAAMALTDAPIPSEGGKTSYIGKAATFRGEFGFSLGLTHRLKTETPLALSASVSHSGGDNTGASIAISGEF